MNEKTTPQADLVFADLLKDGWREYPNQFKTYARCFYRQFYTTSRCDGNKDKAGVPIEIAVTEHDGRISMELSMFAGLKDGTWIDIKNYALPKTVEEVKEIIPRLLAMWESANAETDSRIR